jgi:hypothetical protein
MVRGSARYASLRRRLEELEKHLLSFLPPPPLSTTVYTPRQFDLTRSYIVLAHAEIEAFCEEIAVLKANKAMNHFRVYGTIRPILRKIVAYYVIKEKKSWSHVSKPSATTIETAFQSYLGSVRDNHGIKRLNIGRLFYPLGISEASLDTTWLTQMDTFGSNRGTWAHSSIKAHNPPDPHSEVKNVKQLMEGLLLLDGIMRHLK